MADLIVLLFSLPLLFTTLTIIPFTANAISSCNDLCQTPNDCDGQLICINGKCNDNPDVRSNVCRSPSPPGGGGGSCESAGNLTCHGKAYSKYNCSPPITSSTRAKLTNNDFTRGGDRGGPSKCDKRYHSNLYRVVALSTGWYNGGSMCGKLIRIRARNGKRTTAKVVDECDSMLGCDEEDAYQPPCKNNIVHGSIAVWKALGLDKEVSVVDVTWSMA